MSALNSRLNGGIESQSSCQFLEVSREEDEGLQTLCEMIPSHMFALTLVWMSASAIACASPMPSVGAVPLPSFCRV